ncbi:MAG: class I SAM-dependent methyltransferase, partial [Actinobacteria bacterium]|nr:class I SAM-dependent methyltransferase [Actinomycetota bacterium]
FGARYSDPASSGLDDVEKAVIGGVWGANGYTTVAEADRLADALLLSSDHHLLDVGSGRGWPGLYLAKQTGCRVTLADLPIEGLELARTRASREGLRLIGAVVASGRHLPFAMGSFDAIVHTDVLC